MDIEEAKIALSRTFRDTSNLAVSTLLDKKVGFNSATALMWGDTEYHDIYVDEFNMIMRVVNRVDEGTQIHYNEITFEHPAQNRADMFHLTKGKIPLSSFEVRTVIKDGLIRFINASEDICVSDDYNISLSHGTILSGVEFDVINHAFSMVGVRKDYPNPFDYADSLGWLNNDGESEKVFDAFDKECANNPAFKQATEAICLREYITHTIKAIVFLYEYMLNESIQLLLKEPKWREALQEYSIVGYYKCTKSLWLRFMMYFKHGNTIPEILGIDEKHIFLLHPKDNDFHFVATMKLINELKKVESIFKLDSVEEFCTFFGIDKFTYPTILGKLVRLGKMGYTYNELKSFLLKANKKQAIEVYEAFDLLYEIVTYQELLTGKRRKFFPSYLKVTKDVFRRDANLLRQQYINGENTRFIDNFMSRRADIVIDEKTFEICIPEMGDEKAYSLPVSASEAEYLIFRKKRGKYHHTITMVGDTIINVSGRLSDKHIENIEEWVRQNCLILNREYLEL